MKTLVIGASEKPERYSNKAIRKLISYGHQVVPLAPRAGQVEGMPFETGFPELEDIDTITLYIGPARQKAYYTYLLELKPRRIIFNPGTENQELELLATQHGIETITDCTLVLLDNGMY